MMPISYELRWLAI